jgi:hypothetical protein
MSTWRPANISDGCCNEYTRSEIYFLGRQYIRQKVEQPNDAVFNTTSTLFLQIRHTACRIKSLTQHVKFLFQGVYKSKDGIVTLLTEFRHAAQWNCIVPRRA